MLASSVSLETVTDVRMNKKGNPFYGRVKKVSRKNVRPIPDYEKRMQKTTPDFVVGRNNVGNHVSACVLYNEKYNKYYFSYETFGNSIIELRYIDVDGNPVQESQIKQFIPAGKKRDVNIFSVSTENIKAVTIAGTRYEVVE